VITAQAFQATPRHHTPAVVVGLLPGVAAWGALMAKNGLRAAGYGAPDGPAFGPELIDAFRASDTWIHGAFALEQGFIFAAMILAAATVCIIERRFAAAGLWCVVAAAISAVGLMHSYRFTPGDTAVSLTPAWPWVAGYLVMAAFLLAARWITVPNPGDSSSSPECPAAGTSTRSWTSATDGSWSGSAR
jgi:AGZA family xanthine/uracil permease-like MFS transporter